MKKIFFVLWIAGILGTIAVLPYAFTLQHDVLVGASISLLMVAFFAVVQTAVLLAIALFFGLKLSQSLGLTTLTLFDPNTSTRERLRNVFFLAIPVGVITGVIITLGDIIFGQYIPQLTGVNAQVSIWKTLLASFYGGIVEEILMRLFLVSLFAWLFGKIFRSVEVIKNNWIMWAAIVIVAIIFGLGHLPITASITQITSIVITRAIVLNGIGGLVFGWLYWKRGLEYSIVAHFFADIILLVIFPVLLK